MKLRHKKNPIDRALEEVNRQLAELQRNARQELPRPAAERSGTAPVKDFIREMLTPPSRRQAVTYRTRRELPDCEVNPVAALETEDAPVVRQHQPDLFAHAHAASAKPPVSGDEKLAKLLAAGTVRPPKPTLKRVERENRRRFFMWMGLSVLAVWVLYTLVR